jgi:glycine cleavage system H lipoate-binding protein
MKVDGDEGTVGITDHAQDALSDIVYLELPNVGDSFGIGDTFGVVESVKAAADLYMPVSGDVTAVNEPLIDTPEALNKAPYGCLARQDQTQRPQRTGKTDGRRRLPRLPGQTAISRKL